MFFLGFSEEVRERIDRAQNPNTPPEALKTLATDEYSSVRCRVAENPSTPPEVLKTLATDEHYYVRSYVATNPNTPQETLKTLATDESWVVRHEVGKNPNSTELIKRLVLMTDAKASSQTATFTQQSLKRTD